MSKKRTEYSDTFKAEAIAKLKENNNNVTQTAKELGIPMNTLKNWQRDSAFLPPCLLINATCRMRCIRRFK